jgi:hypothetical protein
LLFSPINFAQPTINDYANIYVHNKNCGIISKATGLVKGVNASVKPSTLITIILYPCNSAILDKFIKVGGTHLFRLPLHYKKEVPFKEVSDICLYAVSSSSFLSNSLYTNDDTVQRYTIEKDSIGCKITR